MLEYLTDTVIHIKNRVSDEWNSFTPTQTTVPARIDYETKLIKDVKGNEVVSSIQITFDGDYDIKHADLIVIDDIKNAIIKIIKPKAFSVEFTKVYLS